MNSKALRVLASLLLILSLLTASFGATAESAASDDLILREGETEGSFSGEDSWIPADDVRFSSESASKAFIRNTFYPSEAKSSTVLANRLDKENRALYDNLLKDVKGVSRGDVSHTVFQAEYSFSCTIASVQNSKDKFREKVNEQVTKVLKALLGDCPSELYWFDKVYGALWDYDAQYNSRYIWINEIRVAFYVAEDYSSSGSTHTFFTDTGKAQAIRTAAANAKNIVEANRGLSDSEKLKAYKNAICALADYNYDTNQGTPYGNPWQLVWVFDGDPATKVVCEGYSKAFQYLWELSAFNGNVTSMLMTGKLLFSDGSGGNHMWNVVTMSDSKKYMVDVTNCDTGATGSDLLFLTGYDFTTTISGSKAYCYSGHYYVFDKDVTGLYQESDQNLSGTDYDPDEDEFEYSGTCGKDAEWALRVDGILKISGSGNMDDYSGPSYAPWYPYRDKIRTIIIGDEITKIGNNAFSKLTKATAVLIGSGIKKIGTKAFYKSSNLTNFTIRTTKLKASKVGANAFKGTAKDAVYTCPAGKVAAYKSLLIKKGASKTATYK